jgi:hypothetical protein
MPGNPKAAVILNYKEPSIMDLSISAAFTQCAALQNQLHFWQKVVVPVHLEFHAAGPDQRDPTGQTIVTTDVTADGNLVYIPTHLTSFNQQIPGTPKYTEHRALVPQALTGTIAGDGDVESPAGGGGFSAPAIHIAINAPLPLLGGTTAHVGVHSSVHLLCDFDEEKDETTLPIQLTTVDANNMRSNVVIHLDTPKIIDVPVVSGPLGIHL